MRNLLLRLFRRGPRPDPPEPKIEVNRISQGSPHVLAKLPSKYIVDVNLPSSISWKCELVRLTIKRAELVEFPQPGRYFCTLSIGKQSLLSNDVVIKGKIHEELDWHAGSEFVVYRGGASMVRIAVFKRGSLRNNLLGFSEIDLTPLLDLCQDKTDGSIPEVERSCDLLDPVDGSRVGLIEVSGKASGICWLEQQMWEHLLMLADWNETYELNFDEFMVLIQSFGSEATRNELFEVFERAQSSSSDPESTNVPIHILARSLAFKGDGSSIPRFLPTCPVDGAELSRDPEDRASNVLYVWLALSSTEANRETNLKAGYMTEAQAASSWAMRLSEWASHPVKAKKQRGKQLGGLRLGTAAEHILVFDRKNRRVIEEIVNPVIILAMRTMYQSRMGRKLLNNDRFLKRLTDLSIKEGHERNSPESAKDIKRFVESFKGQIDIDSAEKPIHEYKTFNEFFYRKLKPGARPIHENGNPNIIVSAADCRLQVFNNVDEATRFWVKGKNFSLAGLLGDRGEKGSQSERYKGGALCIFRLAPQDYHRYHSPVKGRVKSIRDIPGHLLTVNPIAVNTIYCDVFTVNKRSVMTIETDEFGDICFVAIGATLVGSIFWTVDAGACIAKGDELGYFAFGGSTCIAVFQQGKVSWDEDIEDNSHRSLETLVRMGESIGYAKGTTVKEEKQQQVSESVIASKQAAEDAGVIELEKRQSIMGDAYGPLDSPALGY